MKSFFGEKETNLLPSFKEQKGYPWVLSTCYRNFVGFTLRFVFNFYWIAKDTLRQRHSASKNLRDAIRNKLGNLQERKSVVSIPPLSSQENHAVGEVRCSFIFS